MLQQKLATEASKLSRRIYASLPFGYRFAQLCLKLSIDSQTAFGEFVYSEFVKAEVKDLPDARDFVRRFGGRAYGTLLRLVKSPQVVDEILSRFMLRMAEGKVRIKKRVPVKAAMSYVMRALTWIAKDIIQQRYRQKEVPLTIGPEGKELEIEPRQQNLWVIGASGRPPRV